MTPEIVYSIRNNAKGVNYIIAENQRFAMVPADMTLGIVVSILTIVSLFRALRRKPR